MASKKKNAVKVAPQKSTDRHPRKGKSRPASAVAADAAAKPKKVSALDAAAKVLDGAAGPLNCQEMIQQMAAKGYWTSPGGKTPQATLFSAILREIQTKGDRSRFEKAERGKFTLRQTS
jgi:hypothetical protein